jgi:hypothetical protein
MAEMDQRTTMAAALGDTAALVIVPSPQALPDHHRSKVELALARLSHRETIHFAIDCARRALPTWETLFPDDRRPASAVTAATLWMSGDCVTDDLLTAAANAEAAGHEADEQQLEPMDDHRIFAIYACSAASHVALTAESAAEDGSEVAKCAAWAASFARKATDDPVTEEQWQLRRLCDYLMGRATSPYNHPPA